MTGNLDKDVYQSRRAALSKQAEFIDAEIKRVEHLLQDAEMACDSDVTEAYEKMKKLIRQRHM